MMRSSECGYSQWGCTVVAEREWSWDKLKYHNLQFPNNEGTYALCDEMKSSMVESTDVVKFVMINTLFQLEIDEFDEVTQQGLSDYRIVSDAKSNEKGVGVKGLILGDLCAYEYVDIGVTWGIWKWPKKKKKGGIQDDYSLWLRLKGVTEEFSIDHLKFDCWKWPTRKKKGGIQCKVKLRKGNFDMRKWPRRKKGRSLKYSSEVTICGKVVLIVGKIIEKYGINSCEIVKTYYQIAVDPGFTRGCGTAQVGTAYLYVACWEQEKPFLFIEFSISMKRRLDADGEKLNGTYAVSRGSEKRLVVVFSSIWDLPIVYLGCLDLSMGVRSDAIS